jgi:hypothetical protein
MKLDTSDPAFEHACELWLASLPGRVLESFDAVLARSPGYYPTTLLEIWSRFVAERGIATKLPDLPLAAVVELPVGHPLDFDWRFTPDTRDFLLRQVEASTPKGGTVLYLGTPTLFVRALDSLPSHAHVLIDANAAMIRSVSDRLGDAAAHQVVIGQDATPSDINADACVVDPPWYPEVTEAFLRTAADNLPIGGTILLSQAPLAARPGVEEERARLANGLDHLGLVLESVELNSLRYETPHFERMSLMAAAPTMAIPRDWRTGDLLRIRKARVVSAALPDLPPADEGWTEVHFGPVRIKVRNSGCGDLDEVEPGLDRLTTVSRRDRRRPLIGFWTSGNRVRAATHVNDLVELIRLCDAELRNMTFTHTIANDLAASMGVDSRVAHRLTEILLVEYQEHIAGGYGVVG